MIELILYSAFVLLLVRHRFFWVARRRKLSSKDSPLIMAHRGLKTNSPENTISSYKEAIAAEAKAKANGLKLQKVEERRAAQEECDRENAKN